MERMRNICKLFQRDERGQAMVITAILALVLFRSVMASYNTGVAVSARIRAQVVADSAAFSGAIWQARFLNYCAYTRRAIIANYAHIALMNANIVNKKALDNIYDCNDLWITAYTDRSIVKDSLDLLGWARDILVPTEGDHGEAESGNMLFNVVDGQRIAEHQNAMLAESQVALHSVIFPIEGIQQKIIDDSCILDDEISLAGLSHALGGSSILSSGGGTLGAIFDAVPLTAALNANLMKGALGNPDLPLLNALPPGMVHRKDNGTDHTRIKIDEITPAFDAGHTKISWPWHWGLQVIQGRPFTAFGDPMTENPDYLKIMMVNTFPLPWFGGNTSIKNQGGQGKVQYKTGENGFYGFPGMLGMYLWFYLRIDTPFGPIIIIIATPILGNGEEFEYDSRHKLVHVYEVRKQLLQSTDFHLLEPSVYSAVAMDVEKLPYFRPNPDVPERHLKLLDEARDTVAIARAKVYFQPPGADEITKRGAYPDTHYPFYGAKLATIKEGGKKQGAILGPGMMLIEGVRNPIDLLYGVPIWEEAIFRALGWGVNY